MADLLLGQLHVQTRLSANAWSAVRQEVFFDVVAVGLEHDARAAQLPDLLGGPLDHAVPLAGMRGHHLASASNLEALLGARLGLHLGHLALLCRPKRGPQSPSSPDHCSIERAD